MNKQEQVMPPTIEYDNDGHIKKITINDPEQAKNAMVFFDNLSERKKAIETRLAEKYPFNAGKEADPGEGNKIEQQISALRRHTARVQEQPLEWRKAYCKYLVGEGPAPEWPTPIQSGSESFSREDMETFGGDLLWNEFGPKDARYRAEQFLNAWLKNRDDLRRNC